MRILLIDNFDSFTYNLVHYIEREDIHIKVVRNNQLNELSWSDFDKVIISPGPGLPNEAGTLMTFLNEAWGKIPILGVCLGLQAIALYEGGCLYNLNEVKHGISTLLIKNTESKLFKGLPDSFKIGLYHSWAATPKDVPNFNIIGTSQEGVLMAIEHKTLPIFGVQFHPESILTEHGKEIIANFLAI